MRVLVLPDRHGDLLRLFRGLELAVLLDEEIDQQATHDQVAGSGVQAGEVATLDDREDEVGDAVEKAGAERVPPQEEVGYADLVERASAGEEVEGAEPEDEDEQELLLRRWSTRSLTRAALSHGPGHGFRGLIRSPAVLRKAPGESCRRPPDPRFPS